MAVDGTLISGIATAVATVAAAALLRVGKKSGNRQDREKDAGERAAVSLTKQLMTDQRRDLDRARRRIRELEEETRLLRGERDQYREELDYAHVRISQLGGP